MASQAFHIDPDCSISVRQYVYKRCTTTPPSLASMSLQSSAISLVNPVVLGARCEALRETIVMTSKLADGHEQMPQNLFAYNNTVISCINFWSSTRSDPDMKIISKPALLSPSSAILDQRHLAWKENGSTSKNESGSTIRVLVSSG